MLILTTLDCDVILGIAVLIRTCPVVVSPTFWNILLMTLTLKVGDSDVARTNTIEGMAKYSKASGNNRELWNYWCINYIFQWIIRSHNVLLVCRGMDVFMIISREHYLQEHGDYIPCRHTHWVILVNTLYLLCYIALLSVISKHATYNSSIILIKVAVT